MTDAEHNKRQRERYHWLKEHGICTACAQMWVEPGHAYCKACARKKDKYKDARREHHIELMRGLREYRSANGLCSDCGKPAADGRKRCERCLALQRDRNVKFRLNKQFEEEARKARERMVR